MEAYTGEQVLWTGKPVHRPLLNRHDHNAVLIGAVVLAVVGTSRRTRPPPKDRTRSWR
ncbi:hypothetical protein [Amycolatopsis sp. cmx-8-4]|uniref:hypothetical protein n=1 Tax=Amycolatopsis sp. cmx-8-4 TaxID=2790947 RepID=UPI00397DB0B6